MNQSLFRIALAGTMLVAIAGCAKKKPAELPPPPVQDTPNGPYSPPPPGGTSNAPGSRADFVAQAGTDTIHFATDSSDVDGESQSVLRAQSQWLKRYPNVVVTIEGHCDERGTREYNIALGDRRANAAKAYLASLGVTNRMSVISYGKERPVAMGSDEDSWAQNRRAVTIVPVNAAGGGY